MDCKWEVDGEIHIYEERHVKRYLIAPMTMIPRLLKLHNGDLLAIVRAGDFHFGERGRLDCVRSCDGGISWGQPSVVVADGPDDCDPAVIQCCNGTILVMFSKLYYYLNGQWSEEKWLEEKGKENKPFIWITRSDDNGHTWSAAIPVQGLPRDVTAVYGRMVQLPDGSIWTNVRPGCDIARSRDLGRTWGECSASGFDSEVAFLPLPSGKVIAVTRRNPEHLSDVQQEPYSLWQSDSFDGGCTWSETRKLTGYMEHPADLLLLETGNILLTYGRRRSPYGIQAMLSYDQGVTWDVNHKIALVCDAENMEVGYPSSVQLDDGTICTAYYAYQDPFHITARFRGYHSWGLHTAVVRYREEDILPQGLTRRRHSTRP